MSRDVNEFESGRRLDLESRSCGDSVAGVSALRALARRSSSLADLVIINAKLNRLEREDPAALGPRHSLAILRSHTVEPLVPAIRSHAFAAGLVVDVSLGRFNAIESEIFADAELIAKRSYDSVVIIRTLDDTIPELGRDFAVTDSGVRAKAANQLVAATSSMLDGLVAKCDGSIFLSLLVPPASAVRGLADSQDARGQWHAIAELNDRLRQLAAERIGVYALDLPRVAFGVGLQNWYDVRAWESVRMPYSGEALNAVAASIARHLVCSVSAGIKCLVCDLDNTLWGGVVGEDGPDGIVLGPTGEGAHYQQLHRCLLGLRSKGILLAIASKNNPEDVDLVLRDHPGMLLRAGHFSASRVGWGDKAESIRQIAQELNIGLSAIAFLDDNPAERSLVSSELPDVHVLDFPLDAAGLEGAVLSEVGFDRLSISSEDGLRAEMYEAQRERRTLQESSSNLEEYYVSLRQRIRFSRLTASTVARIAQMTQKTNQFNLTTKRYAEAEIAAILEDPQRRAYCLEVSDRFGDNGIVGAAIVDVGDTWRLDSFLLSCRVIGRMVEHAFLALVCEAARSEGGRKISAMFIPTAKNNPAKGFLSDFGMTPIIAGDSGGVGTLYELDLADDSSSRMPSYFEII